MAIKINKININNNEVGLKSIITPLNIVTINWDIETTTPSIKQLSYEIRIGTHSVNWGTSYFISDVVRQPYSRDSSQYWVMKEKFLQRGSYYYGQIRVKDTTGFESEWVKFSFNVNRLPFLTYAKITPENPSENNDLDLSIGNSSENSIIKTKWFRNGIHYKQFDNYQKISREYLVYGESWYCEVTPFDGIENGPAITAKSVTVSKLPPVSSDLKILPISPNVNDILEASYTVKDPNTDSLLIKDKSQIRWYVNNQLLEEANNEKFVRFGLKPNDEVFFTIVPSDGIFYGESVSSKRVKVKDQGFKSINLRVDGLVDNLNVNNVNPTIEWDVVQPFDRTVKFALIKIGTSSGSDNVYNSIIEIDENKFSIPDNLIRRGIDYFVSVSTSDRKDDFRNFAITRFRVAGNLWETDVSNKTGWTIETSLTVSGEDGYQKFLLADGSKFAELRFFKNKIDLMLGKSNIMSFDIDMTFNKNIIICGKENTIKVFAENELIIDASNKFLEKATDKFIEIGSSASSNVSGFFKRIVYNVDGYYEPGSSVYSNINLEKLIDFTGMEISDISQYNGDIIVAANPLNESESGSIYKVVETGKAEIFSTENIDTFSMNVNSINTSPDEKVTYVSHSTGTSLFNNYFIPKYDSESVFSEGLDPLINFWELTKTTPFVASSYINEGLVIDTTSSNRQVSISENDVVSTKKVAALSFVSLYDSVFSYSFEMSVTLNDLTIFLAGTETVAYTTTLIGKSINDLVLELKSLNSSDNYFFSLLYDVFVNDTEIGVQSAKRLIQIDKTPIFPLLSLNGNYQVSDPYNPNPYGTLSTGKWFYSHRKKGTPWFEKVDNKKGWTVDFDFRIDTVEDSNTPSNTGKPKGLGLYFNDGYCFENLWFLPQEIIFEQNNQVFTYDTTEITKYRLVGKDSRVKLYAKKDIDKKYSLIAEVPVKSKATNQSNAGKPTIFSDNNGNSYAVWHDDGRGNNRNQIYYSYFSVGSGWSEPELIVSDDFSSSNPDITVDSLGNVYVVYETTKSDYTDISVIMKNDIGWSDPYLITSNLYDSFSPKIVCDSKNNIHVVWEDCRNSQPQIFYSRRNSSNGQWINSSLQNKDIQITREPVGAKRPSIVANNNNLYMSWTSFNTNGTSSIKMAMYDQGKDLWNSLGQGGSDFSVSGISSYKADNSDICVDLKGQICVVWQDVVNYNIQIFSRFINSRIVYAKNVLQLTRGDYDSSRPKCGLDLLTGNIYVLFEKEQEKIVSPYDPYGVRENDIGFKNHAIYMCKWDSQYQVWYSSNQSVPAGYKNSFDLEFSFALPRQVFKPTLSKKFNGTFHILFESLATSADGEIIENKDLFNQIRDIVYDFSFDPIYNVEEKNQYGDSELNLSGSLYRKEIRFGDFSDNLSNKMVIGSLKYYLSDAVDPFSISLISSATVNMPSTEIFCSAPNNNGDSWLGSNSGLLFYNKKQNNVYLLDSENSNIKGLAVKSIDFDRKSNMFISTSDGLYVSQDHAHFFKFEGSVPSVINSIDIDNLNNLYIASNSGLYIINLNSVYSKIIINKENVSSKRKINISDSEVLILNKEKGLPTNNLRVVKVDALNVAWIGSDSGLIRYHSGDVSVFNTLNGLNSNKINDISIRNTAIRYIATTSGINKMVGISISNLNFNNANTTPSSGIQTARGDVNLPSFVNARSIKWKDPNVLWVSSSSNVFQITFVEESFNTEKTETTKFFSSDFSLSNFSPKRNDDLQTFRLIGIENKSISKNTMFEVILNGNKITRGYDFSPENNLLRFKYPIKETDIVNVNVRYDIEKIGNFEQNKAQKIAIGNKATRIGKLLSSKGNIYSLTNGDINTVHINDDSSDLPFDKIILDRTPPSGKISIGNRRERSLFEVNISPLADDTDGVFDAVSGIDKMVVSNFPNFTSDGETPLEPMVFSRLLLHNIGDIFDAVSKQYTFTNGKGNRIFSYSPVGGDPVIMAGTSSPANVYKYNGISQSWDKIDSLDVSAGIQNPNSSVEFLIEYQGKVYAGTGNSTGSGKLWVMNPATMKFDLIRTLPSNTHAYCATIFDGVLYIGGGGGSYGALYSFDGTTTKEVFKNISGAIYSLVESDRELYAATGFEGRIYKLDTKNNTQQIVDTNADRNVISIGKATIGDQGYIFAGMSSNGQIKRSKVPNSPFVHSFKTVSSAVNCIRNINGKLYASIGNVLYSLDNVWNAKYSHREVIKDVVGGPGDSVWFVSDSYIYKIGKAENVKKVYLKLIDKAGNETKLYTDTSQTELNADLFDEISISDLASFINRNRILKVDNFGNATAIREGNDRFYSADVVEEESGEYYSEIFNGTNNLVSWDKISWDASIPDNTEVVIHVKTGATRDEILDKEFNFYVNGKEQSADISFLSGQFIQFKVVMKSRVRGLSPALRNVVIKSISSDSTHFFTTNFSFPSRVKGGIITSTKMLPVSADVVFGINTNNSTDFSDYQIVDENRIFTTSDNQVGTNLRVGIRLITPTKSEQSSFVPDEYSPYGSVLMFNAVEWNYKNEKALERNCNFKVNFYEDSGLTNLVYSSDSSVSYVGFSSDGDIFPTGGVSVIPGKTVAMSFTPVGDTPLKCNTYYYVKIDVEDEDGTSNVHESLSFVQSCGTTYVDTISFDFLSTSLVPENYHFRIRFYNDPERTDLRYTAFSGNDILNWFVNESSIPVDGFASVPNQLLTVNYTPLMSDIDPNKTYYLSIDVFNGEIFENNSNSFTFKANDLSSQIYCGSYEDVPVVKNFSVMFELENNEFISMRAKV